MSFQIAFGDFETRSVVDIKKCGAEVYAQHPLTSVMLLNWLFDDEKTTSVWCPFYPQLNRGHSIETLFEHVAAKRIFVAHNARFELLIWAMMTARFGWPVLAPEFVRCTMSFGRALSLPGSLDQMAHALRLTIAKDLEGYKLMLKMCKPRKPRKGEPKDAIIWNETLAEFERLIPYCDTDVFVEREFWHRLPPLPPSEQELWAIDQRINDRGVFLDRRAIGNLIEVTARETKRLEKEVAELTDYRVKSARQIEELRGWMAENGLRLENLKKGTVKNALKRADLAPAVRRVLELRQEAGKASTSKLKAMSRGMCGDDRARGLLEYHGAGTGRWAGRRVQTQNMPRTPDEFEVEDAEAIFEWAAVPNGELGIAAEFCAREWNL